MQCRIGKRFLFVAAFAVSGLFLTSLVGSQESYPSQNVRLVVAFAPGGPTDIIARLVGQRLGDRWGQGVIIENRGGAGGNIATRQVAKAEPNGYTVLVTTSAYAVNPSLSANAGYAPETDFKTPIIVATTPNIIVAAPGLKASTLREMVEAAKTEKFSYGTAGVGTTPHLSAERIFKVLAKVDIPHVPFTGGGPALNALLGGHVTLVVVAMPPAVELIKSGQIKALAVTTAKRLPSLPDVPTAAEQGFGDSEESTWVALFVPAGTPTAVLAKLNADVNAVLAESELRQRLDQIGFIPVGGTLAESEAYVRTEIGKWGQVVREIGLKVD